jgi:hypothetical protein
LMLNSWRRGLARISISVPAPDPRLTSVEGGSGALADSTQAR